MADPSGIDGALKRKRLNPFTRSIIAATTATASSRPAQESPRYPVMLHVGKIDTGIPKENWEKVLRIHPTLPVHGYPAGHGFSCGARGSGREPSARLARERPLAFFRQHIG